MKTLDFTKVKKEYFTVKLNDNETTTLMITTPKKNIFESMVDMGETLSHMDLDGMPDRETLDVMDQLYEICASIMSSNKGGIRITADHLSGCMDFQELIMFFTAYVDFVTEFANAKN